MIYQHLPFDEKRLHSDLDKNKREAGDVHHLMQRMIFYKRGHVNSSVYWRL
ncbi:hypothetical protein MUS_2869 [Bacillus velezensis YAU B9601-Y2]|uniref:Uncharacterized protein n=1 Tax=Bacillus amyloliquefaciens (strain Y2) TaxID=1155777 RepID=I2C802_BACAY|nr:hypothetical protein MUS_2869 [Bacillus velezensis YAU B9601-Y2]